MKMANSNPVINRQTYRPPVVRNHSKLDVMINSVILFFKRLSIQLSKTLAATALAAAADYIRRKADSETTSILNQHGGVGVQQPDQQDRRNLYGQNYQNQNQGQCSGQYGNGYNQQRSYGHDTFPGF